MGRSIELTMEIKEFAFKSAVDSYPTLEQVERADVIQLGGWCRFLPVPGTDEEFEILNVILNKFHVHGGWTPQLSKYAGWGKINE